MISKYTAGIVIITPFKQFVLVKRRKTVPVVESVRGPPDFVNTAL